MRKVFSGIKRGLSRWFLSVILLVLVGGVFFSPFQLQDTLADNICGDGFTPVEDRVTGNITCFPNDGGGELPEMPVMLLPFFIVAAATVGARIRRKAMKD